MKNNIGYPVSAVEPMAGVTQSERALDQITSVGIIGGGQLGCMMAVEAKKLGFNVRVLEQNDNAPASRYADDFVVGDAFDEAVLQQFVEDCDVVTFERDHVPSASLVDSSNACVVHPRPSTMEIIKDKQVQRTWLQTNCIKQPVWQTLSELSTYDELLAPTVVLKRRTQGYDGRGVRIVRNAWQFQCVNPEEWIAEELVAIKKEISVIVVRDEMGNVAAYDPAENIMDKEQHILLASVVPAGIDPAYARVAQNVAKEIVALLDDVGTFAVELFLTENDQFLVNEISARPHNTGHWTNDVCLHSQFGNHIRAVTGMPIGSTASMGEVVSINILSDATVPGAYKIEGLEQIAAMPNATLHLYSKVRAIAGRKMGHINVVVEDAASFANECLALANAIRFVPAQEEVHGETDA